MRSDANRLYWVHIVAALGFFWIGAGSVLPAARSINDVVGGVWILLPFVAWDVLQIGVTWTIAAILWVRAREGRWSARRGKWVTLVAYGYVLWSASSVFLGVWLASEAADFYPELSEQERSELLTRYLANTSQVLVVSLLALACVHGVPRLLQGRQQPATGPES